MQRGTTTTRGNGSVRVLLAFDMKLGHVRHRIRPRSRENDRKRVFQEPGTNIVSAYK